MKMFEEEIINLIQAQIHRSDVKVSDTFYDLHFDPLDLTELGINIGTELNLDIPDELYKLELKTVGDLAKYIKDLVVNKPPDSEFYCNGRV